MELIYYPNNKYSLGSKGRKLSIYNQDESKPSPKIKQLLREGAKTPPDFKFVYNSENLKKKNEFILIDKLIDKRNTKNPKLKAKFREQYKVLDQRPLPRVILQEVLKPTKSTTLTSVSGDIYNSYDFDINGDYEYIMAQLKKSYEVYQNS